MTMVATLNALDTRRAEAGGGRGDGGRRGIRPRRRPSLVLTGVLLVVVTAAVFVWLQLNTDRAVDVVAVGRPVAAGQVIAAADLRVVRVVPDPSVSLVRAIDASTVVGHTAAVPLVPGSLLSPSQIGVAAWPPAGEAVIAVPVKPGRLPVGVMPGARVQVLTVRSVSSGSADTASGLAITATVVEVAHNVDSSGSSVVSLLVAASGAAVVAATDADVALVLLGPQG